MPMISVETRSPATKNADKQTPHSQRTLHYAKLKQESWSVATNKRNHQNTFKRKDGTSLFRPI